MSDSDGLAGNSSSNGGGVMSDGGGVGAGHTTLSGAVEQADKAIRDMASAIIFGGDIDWNLLRDDLRRLSNGLNALDDLCLHFDTIQSQSSNFALVELLSRRSGQVPPHPRGTRAFHPTMPPEGRGQEDEYTYPGEGGLRGE